MISIKKISVSNFKSFASDLEIEMGCEQSGSLMLLGGPNGYGKTSVFDALEIVLTGSLKKAIRFSGVERDTSNFSRMPYHNTTGKDVVFKVWLCEKKEDSSIDHIIVRRYPKESEGKVGGERTNKTFRFFDLLKCHYSNDPDFFEKEDYSGVEEKESSDIAEILKNLLYAEKPQDVLEGYPLVNYVQQEENIYFLSKSEREKNNSLSFLFQTEEYENLKEGIRSFQTKTLNVLTRKLEAEIESLRNIQSADLEGKVFEYKQLFPQKEVEFDKEDPFAGLNAQKINTRLTSLLEKIEEVRIFIGKFSPRELKRSKLKKDLEQLLGEDQDLKALLLTNFLEKTVFDEFKTSSERLEKAERHQQKLQSIANTGPENTEAEIRAVLEFLNASEEELATLRNTYSQLKNASKSLSSYQTLISNLSTTRDRLLESLRKLHDSHQELPEEGACPLCGHEYGDYEKLIDEIEKQSEIIRALSEGKDEEKQRLLREINENFVGKPSQRIAAILEDAELNRRAAWWPLIKAFQNYAQKNTTNKELLRSADIDSEPFNLPSSGQVNSLEQNLKSLKERIEAAHEAIQIAPEQIERADLFETLFESSEEQFNQLSREKLDEKIGYLNQLVQDKANNRMDVLQSRKEKIENFFRKVDQKFHGPIENAIRAYKSETVRLLKIPLYIYSSKILQNCPQGDGIFLSMKDTGDIRLLVDNYTPQSDRSDHDIIHHLSSGQLAVVSIAFCLALNKLSKTNFKFIAIDDPLQTLDDLNIHSFVEVVRHDFKDYQLLFSTHEDDAAKYLYYRFWKAGFKVTYKDVKEVFLALPA